MFRGQRTHWQIGLMVSLYGTVSCVVPEGMLQSASAETLVIPSYGIPSVESPALELGREYVVEVTGTFVFDMANGRQADAEWSNYWGYLGDPTWYENPAIENPSLPEPDPLDLLIDGAPVDWLGTIDGANFTLHTYSPTHTYRYMVTGAGVPMNFQIADPGASQPWDNSGSLLVTITPIVPDADGDGVPDADDECPNDSGKIEPGQCGCSIADTDSDQDGTADCQDDCASFDSQAEHAVGPGPRAVATGDYDGDGVIDLAVTNAFPSSVSVLTGNCNGTYARRDIFVGAGANTWNIATADIDHDADLDLVITNSSYGNIQVLRNPGDGQFTLEAPIPTGAGAHWIAMADFDNDGHVDLAVANFYSWARTITLLWNDGSGHFLSFNQLATNGTNPYALATGDLNSDQRIDLIMTSEGDQKVDVFINLGGRVFAVPATYTMGQPGDQLTGVVLARIDSDPHLDAVITDYHANVLFVLKGVGDGTFAAQGSLSVNSPADLAVADLDGNGTLDLVVACQQPTNQLAYILNDGMGGFGPPIYLPAGDQPVFAKTADLDRDGDQDIILVNYNNSGNISIYYNRCISADTDADGVYGSCDNCPSVANPDQADSDSDGMGDACDGCPNDPNKTDPGICDCGTPDTDSDGDGTPNCHDPCSDDPNKIEEGICGCGVADTDTDGDGTADCLDNCPTDPNKVEQGICGCNVADTDTDHDGTANCHDLCSDDPNKIVPGVCNCGTADTIGFVGFLPPIGGADATGGSFANPLRAFKLGSTIPVKFTAAQCGEPLLAGIHTLAAVKYSSAVDSDPPIDATPTDAATSGNQFRLTDGQWHFNLSTRSGFSQGTWKLIATLSDGSTHEVWITIKK